MASTSIRNVVLEFNAEDKIRWQELAPSLQAMINGISNSVNLMNSNLEDISDRISALENRVSVIESIINSGGGSSSGGGGGAYILPTATTNVLGGVKVGEGLSISPEGVLNISGSESGDTYDIAEDGIADQLI